MDLIDFIYMGRMLEQQRLIKIMQRVAPSSTKTAIDIIKRENTKDELSYDYIRNMERG